MFLIIYWIYSWPAKDLCLNIKCIKNMFIILSTSSLIRFNFHTSHSWQFTKICSHFQPHFQLHSVLSPAISFTFALPQSVSEAATRCCCCLWYSTLSYLHRLLVKCRALKKLKDIHKKEMKPVFDAASECCSIARCGSPYLGTPRSALWNALNDVNDALWVLITSTI